MRKHLLAILTLVLSTTLTHAQTISDFEALSLSGPDTFYVNYNTPMNDVGFTNGLAFFSCFYDTSYGGFWSSGFAYSNMIDSVTSGYGNQYSAKAAQGYGGSLKYAAANAGGTPIKIHLSGAAIGKAVKGFYVTNSTYAYNSMRDGDAFAKKFGGTTGNDLDWFKLTIVGYLAGAMTTNTVDFYLADFRFTNNSQDYIIKDWQWVDLSTLGNVDSLSLSLSSSDTSSFGMNTPAFFCIDNFTTNETESVKNIPTAPIAKVYPNPATENLFVELNDNAVKQLNIIDMSGKTIKACGVSSQKMTMSTAALSPGIYLLQLIGDNKVATIRFVKQ